jgi:hypothetical protein
VIVHFLRFFNLSWLVVMNRDEREHVAEMSASPAVPMQTTLSTVKLCLLLSEGDCHLALWNEALSQSFDTFCASLRYFVFLLVVFYKRLEPVRCFVLKMDSDVRDFHVRDGFISPNQVRTSVLYCADVQPVLTF